VQINKAKEKAYVSELETKVQGLDAEISNLKSLLQAAEDNTAAGADELSEAKQEIRQLVETSRHLNNKVLNWEQLEQERSIQRLEQFTAVEAKSSAKDAEINKLKNRQKELSAELKKAVALNPERLNRQNKDLKKRLAESKESATHINEQLRKSKSELKELKAENAKQIEPLYRSEDGVFELRNAQFDDAADAANNDSKAPKVYAVDNESGAIVIAEGLNDADQVEWISSKAVPEDVTNQAAIIIKKMLEDNAQLESKGA